MAVPMAWPTYSRTTEKPAASATSWTARPDLVEAVAGPQLLDPGPQAPLGDLHQPGRLGRDLADAHRVGGVAVVALDDRAAVDRDDVALLEAGTRPGMPWTIMSLGDVQITAGKPW